MIIIVKNILVKPQFLCNLFADVKYVKPQRQCPFLQSVAVTSIATHVYSAESWATRHRSTGTFHNVSRAHTHICRAQQIMHIHKKTCSRLHSLYQHTKGKGKVRVICAAVPIVKASTAKNCSTNIKRYADLTLLITRYLRFRWMPSSPWKPLRMNLPQKSMMSFGKCAALIPQLSWLTGGDFSEIEGRSISWWRSKSLPWRKWGRKHFSVLEAAIEKVTTADCTSTLKHGANNGLYYLLKNSATIVMASHLGSGDDNKAAEEQKFIHHLDLTRDTICRRRVCDQQKSARTIKDARTKGRWEASARFKSTHWPENQRVVRSLPVDQSRELHRTTGIVADQSMQRMSRVPVNM